MFPNVLSAAETTGPISQRVLPIQFYTCLPIAPINLLELLKPRGLISGLKSVVITVRVQPSSAYVSSIIPFSPFVFLHFLLLCLFSSLWLFPPCMWPWHMTHRVKDTDRGLSVFQSCYSGPASPTPHSPEDQTNGEQGQHLEHSLRSLLAEDWEVGD